MLKMNNVKNSYQTYESFLFYLTKKTNLTHFLVYLKKKRAINIQ